MMSKTLPPQQTQRLPSTQHIVLIERLRNVLIMMSAIALSATIWLNLPDLPATTRIVFITFALAILGWTATRINDTYIGLVAALVCLFVGRESPEQFFVSLGDSTIWLLMASFIVAAAVNSSGLAVRMAHLLAARAEYQCSLLCADIGADPDIVRYSGNLGTRRAHAAGLQRHQRRYRQSAHHPGAGTPLPDDHFAVSRCNPDRRRRPPGYR
jgi:hypothetical protein